MNLMGAYYDPSNELSSSLHDDKLSTIEKDETYVHLINHGKATLGCNIADW